MKKTKFMRAALLLLVLTLITSCFVGGTFAKYTTSVEGTDKARVAYWGFDQEAYTEFDLFDGEYNNVKASGEVEGFSNVIAPGTEKSTTFAFSYDKYKGDKIAAPEVAYTFTVNPTITGDYDELDKNANFKWTLAKGNAPATEYDTVANLLAAIKTLSGDPSGTKTYQPGQFPDDFTDFPNFEEVYRIGWKWEFSTNEDADAADTAMGNSHTLENVTFAITVTATQID